MGPPCLEIGEGEYPKTCIGPHHHFEWTLSDESLSLKYATCSRCTEIMDMPCT